MSVAWPGVYAAVLSIVQAALSGTSVYDGPSLVPGNEPQFAVVGDDGNGNAGTFDHTPSQPDISGLTEERGTVELTLIAQSGNTPVGPLRTALFAMVSAIEQPIAADQTLGGALIQSTALVTSGAVEARQTAQGTGLGVRLTVSYTTRI